LIKHRLALVLAGVAVISTAVATASASSKDAPRTMTVAVISSVEYRASVTARKSSAEPPTARVTVEIETRSGGSRTRSAVHALRGVYFWNTLRGPHSLCQLEIETAGGVAHRPVLLVRLLVSPALGCGRAQSFPLSTR
jgi:hypothetical protein